MPELPEGWLRLDAPDFPDGHGQQAGLIEAPLEIPPAAHGDEGHRVKLPAQLFGGCLGDIPGKDTGPPGFPAEFQRPDTLRNHVLIVEGDRAGKFLFPDDGDGLSLFPEREALFAVSAYVPRLLQKPAAESAFRRKEEVQKGCAALSQQTGRHFCFLRG